ncbi:MAG TPA: ribonuclease III [Bryobacteraceae bacterium]|nr:ribonuclease III [Bryobacteraceae bacterium]
MRPDLKSLESAIGHPFRNRELLERALTHSSHVHEKAVSAGVQQADNEQLEFLGDSILGFLISEALVARLPGYSEGRLSKLKARIVSAAHLYGVAERLQLGQYLHLGRGEEMSGGRFKRTLLVNALEALIAALYQDAGIEQARQFVTEHVVGDPSMDWAFSATDLTGTFTDYKSALQELALARKLPLPRYVILKEDGPEHSKTFTIEVRVGKDLTAHAEGYSKKNAAQNAARLVFERLAGEGKPEGSPLH